MESIQLFSNVLKDCGKDVLDEGNISIESTELYHDEIDERIIPTEHIKQLPNPIQFETLLYEDEYGNDWIAGIVMNQDTGKREYIVLILKGEPIFHQFL
jgi:hypothetical protein